MPHRPTRPSVQVFTNLQWAHAYAARGIVPIPLWPGRKVPHASKEYPDRALLGAGFSLKDVGSCEPGWVERCWGSEPSAGIGVVCGSRSRLLIIDVDTKNLGEWAWETWRAERQRDGLELPQAPVVRTPSGGFHLWFKLPENTYVRSWDGWLDGVDVLADGHWAAVPPTRVDEHNKSYEFLKTGVTPEVPDWWLAQLSGRGRRRGVSGLAPGGVAPPNGAGDHGGDGDQDRTAEEWLGERFDWNTALNERVPPGVQQTTLWRAACSCRARRYPDAHALQLLRRLVRSFENGDESDPWLDDHADEMWQRVCDEFNPGTGVVIPSWRPGQVQGNGVGNVVDINQRLRERNTGEDGGGPNDSHGVELGADDGAGSNGESSLPGGGDLQGVGSGSQVSLGDQLSVVPGLDPGNVGVAGTNGSGVVHGDVAPDDALVPPGIDGTGESPGVGDTGGGEEEDTGRNTDRGNAEAFVRAFGDQVLWTPVQGWFTWDGHVWVKDSAARSSLISLTAILSDGWRTRANTIEVLGDAAERADEAQLLRERARRLENVTTINSMLTYAESLRLVNDLELDTHPYLLNCVNGIVDLRTGERLRREPGLFITKITPTAFIPSKTSRLLDNYRETFMPDEEHWEALWRLLGSCIFGHNDYRQFIFLHGKSTTGKSQLLDLLDLVLGSYVTKSDESVFRGHRDERARADHIDLMGARFTYLEELDPRADLHADRVKDLTGGGKIRARKLYKNEYVTRPIEFTPVVAVNDLPKIKNSDPALLRRLKVIPFIHSLLGREDHSVRRLMLTDVETQQAVLAELIAGAGRAYTQGVDDLPAAFNEARASAYGEITGTSEVEEFMGEIKEKKLLVPEPTLSHCVKLNELFELYVTMPGRGRSRGDRELTIRRFGELVRMAGYEVGKANSSVRVFGVGLNGSLSYVKGLREL